MLDFVTVILAAGKGTRMKSKLPKVLHHAAGKSMLQHVIDAADAAGARRNIVVTGFGGETVRASSWGRDTLSCRRRICSRVSRGPSWCSAATPRF